MIGHTDPKEGNKQRQQKITVNHGDSDMESLHWNEIAR